MWILLPHPYCQVTYAGSNSNRVGRAGMLKGQMIKGHVSCPPDHIHQRCLAFDAPNLLIFVRGSIKIPSSRASHLFPFHPLLSCRWCIYYLLGSSCVPAPQPSGTALPFSSLPLPPLLLSEQGQMPRQPRLRVGPTETQLQARLGWVTCPPRAKSTSSALCIKL